MDPSQDMPSQLPEPLGELAGLALDLRWCWDHTSDPLWQAIDPEMWEASPNPWLILRSASRGRLEELAGDQRFLAELAEQVEARRAALAQPTWFSRAAAPGALPGAALFSMEFGLTDALPI
jgi:starch phosphorylase